ncbi:MAG: dUTP diphosphatase [Candidatus Hodarchaeales archaeon]
MRRIIGKILEWFLLYPRKVFFISDNCHQLEIRNIYKGDAGYDLYVKGDHLIKPGEVKDIRTGTYISPKDRIWFSIIGRSSSFNKRGIIVNIAVIDNGYRGEIFAIARNISGKDVFIRDGERICQIVPNFLIPVKFKEGKLLESDRGKRGFGSTGI